MRSEYDDIKEQLDEIEALSSIYNDDWCVLDASYRTYQINIRDDSNTSQTEISLQVTLPKHYPSSEPPEYQINAPWLRGDKRKMIQDALEELYIDHIGESILFMWAEKIREMIPKIVDSENSEGEGEALGASVADNTESDDDVDYSHNQHNNGAKPEAKTEPAGVQLPQIETGEAVLDRRSTFQPHLAPVTSKAQVDLVMSELKRNKKIANATHNIIAYRIEHGSSDVMLHGCEDDGEIAAGSRMLHLLQILDARNVLVVVTRWYGGVHLGPDRFKHINNCARIMLERYGYAKDRTKTKKHKQK